MVSGYRLFSPNNESQYLTRQNLLLFTAIQSNYGKQTDMVRLRIKYVKIQPSPDLGLTTGRY
jgi:hypothetical protein